ncbi:hypothetical protein LCGC14_2293940 [marine sediment metagenome]|uniref:Uncharacterized protein n=1 Tax=marine sediment metagenome TaxID=412755 RepID=A0A0F9FKI4_9ZZZZ
MAEQGAATQRKLWFGEYDLSGDMNAMRLSLGAARQDNTRFGDDTEIGAGGLTTILMEHEGIWLAGSDSVDEVLSAQMAVADLPISIGPETGADGEVGYLFRAMEGLYMPINAGVIGSMHRFRVSAEGSGGDRAVRSTIMHNATRTATANGTARQLGAVTVTQKVYATLHVISASASDTLDVIVESDSASGFGASPETQITFTQATAITKEYQTAAGAITDDWWRVGYTIAGTDPSFEFVVLIGIL